jgi:hypothetical protein
MIMDKTKNWSGKRPVFTIVFSLFILFLFAGKGLAQTDSVQTKETGNWRIDGTFLFHVHEATFTNWASGGDNQLASKIILKPVFNYDNGIWSWENTFDFRYGQQ